MKREDYSDCFLLPFTSHLLLPFSESTEAEESSSSSIKLSDIKQHLANNIKSLLDIHIEHSNNSDLIDNKQPQQDYTSTPPPMVPLSSGSAAASVLPRQQPLVVPEENIHSKLNRLTINVKLRDNELYQQASPTNRNYYDNFNHIIFLANSSPTNLNDDPSPIQQINRFINTMRPT